MGLEFLSRSVGVFFQLLCNITPAHLFCPIHSQAMTTLKSFLKDCKDGKVEEVQRAIARGFDENKCNSIGKTGLMLAILMKRNNVVREAPS